MERALQERAVAASGGGRPADGRLEHGCFVEPPLLTGMRPEVAIWREEVLGPVLAAREVDGLDETVATTNDSRYGLSAAMLTRAPGASHRFADSTDVGQVASNLSTSGWDLHIPFGGFRDSGSAFKEQGLDALRFYTRTKTVAIGFGA